MSESGENDFSAANAAIAVFGFIKDNPKFAIKFALIYGLIAVFFMALSIVGLTFGIISITVPELEDKFGFGFAPFATGAIVVSLIIFVFSLGVTVSCLSMAIRKILTGEEKGFFGLSWGGFEQKLAIIYLAMLVIILGIVFGLILLIAKAGVLGGGDGFVLGIIFVGILVLILSLASIPISIFLTGRYGLFGIFAFKTNTYGIKQAGEFSKGKFGKIFGAFALSYLLWLVIIGVIQLLGGLVLPINPEISQPIATLGAFQQLIFAIFFIVAMVLASAFTYLGYICAGVYCFDKLGGKEFLENSNATN